MVVLRTLHHIKSIVRVVVICLSAFSRTHAHLIYTELYFRLPYNTHYLANHYMVTAVYCSRSVV